MYFASAPFISPQLDNHIYVSLDGKYGGNIKKLLSADPQ